MLDSRRPAFLEELSLIVEGGADAIMLGGDFNLVRDAREKSTGGISPRWVAAFNNFIADSELRELHRIGGRFTWTNNQEMPIRVVLDRILVSGNWEALYPLATVQVITRIGSDHNPLLIDSGEDCKSRAKIFRFEPSWLLQEGFHEWLLRKWPQRSEIYVLDFWHKVSSCLRKALKG